MKGSKLASEIKFQESYAKFLPSKGRLETWEEAAENVMSMHRNKFKDHPAWPILKENIDFAEEMFKEKRILSSMRNLQFREKHITKHNTKLYNCSVTYISRREVFKEVMWVLLCGAGVGYSVENRFISMLPEIKKPEGFYDYIIEDSIEGWAYSVDAVVSAYFDGSAKPVFDYSKIRSKGSLIANEFIAPGPEGLKKSLELIDALLSSLVSQGVTKLSSLNAHDILCMLSDAVLSGGVRRSALIAVFDKDDTDMMSCKTGDWFRTAPWRARANNSVKLLKDSLTEEEFLSFTSYIKQFGEPGVIMVDNMDMLCNPCVEIGFIPINPKNGEHCWSFCNLNEIIGAKCETKEDFFKACRAAAILGTLQASYTDFSFLGQNTIDLVEWEALIGVSITGIMNNPKILLDPEVLRTGAAIVSKVNEIVAGMIGINPAARTTCIKPSGNASVLAETASGCHPAHAKKYFRVIQLNKETPIAKYLAKNHPELLEEGVYSATNSDYACYIPFEEKEGVVVKSDMDEVEFLDAVANLYENWVLPGTNRGRGYSKTITHNVSNTVTVSDWDRAFKHIYENKESFCGLSFIPATGNHAYHQAPFTTVYSLRELVGIYGEGALFASGLIVDILHAFDNDLWGACESAKDRSINLIGNRRTLLLQKDVIRRIKKFTRYFNGDLDMTISCLKDVDNFHRYSQIEKALEKNPVDLSKVSYAEKYLQADTLAGAACSGGACEIQF